MTDRRRLCPTTDVEAAKRCLLEQARYAVEAGVDVIQVRERDLDAAALAALTSEIVALSRGTRTRVVVNDRLDVALAAGASGVHLRADSMPADAVRSLAPPGFLVGRSVHSAEEVLGLPAAVDYLIAGTAWESASKPSGHSVLGGGGLAEIVHATRIPVLAIGGVTIERLSAAAAAGVAGVAAIGLFMAAAEGHAGTPCRAVPLGSIVQTARARFGTSM